MMTLICRHRVAAGLLALLGAALASGAHAQSPSRYTGQRLLVLYDVVTVAEEAVLCPVEVRTLDHVCDHPDFSGIDDPERVCRWTLREEPNHPSRRIGNDRVEWVAEGPLNSSRRHRFQVCFGPNCVAPPECSGFNGSRPKSKHRCMIKKKTELPNDVLQHWYYDIRSVAYDTETGRRKPFDCPVHDPHFVIRR